MMMKPVKFNNKQPRKTSNITPNFIERDGRPEIDSILYMKHREHDSTSDILGSGNHK